MVKGKLADWQNLVQFAVFHASGDGHPYSDGYFLVNRHMWSTEDVEEIVHFPNAPGTWHSWKLSRSTKKCVGWDGKGASKDDSV